MLNWGRRYSLWVFNFGLACCAIEFIATSMSRHDFIRLGVIPFAPGPRQADLMVVSGTVTDKMAPAVEAALRADARTQVRHFLRRVFELRAARTGTRTVSPRASTRSSPSTCTCRAARPGRRPCCRDPQTAGEDRRRVACVIATSPARSTVRRRRRSCLTRIIRPGRPGLAMTGEELSARFHERFGADAAPELSYGQLTSTSRPACGSTRSLRPETSLVLTSSTGSPPSTNWTRVSRSWSSLVARPSGTMCCCAPGSRAMRRSMPSAAAVYRGAAWHERETSRDVRHRVRAATRTSSRCSCPDGFEGHPLRKEFVLAARAAKPWPGAKEPGESDATPPRHQPAPDAAARRPRPADLGTPPAAAPDRRTRPASRR